MSRHEHSVITYLRDEDLIAAAVPRLKAGLDAGATVVIIATADHRRLFQKALDAQASAPKPTERVVLLDAAETLGRFRAGDELDAAAFDRVVGGLIREKSSAGEIVAFGEMVDLLWKEGRRDAALALEALWDRLGAGKSFGLVCSYRIDSRAQASYAEGLEAIATCHTSPLEAPAERAAAAAIDEAVDQVAGPLSRLLSALIDAEAPPGLTPGQRRLAWLRRNLPLTAEKVFGRLSTTQGKGG